VHRAVVLVVVPKLVRAVTQVKVTITVVGLIYYRQYFAVHDDGVHNYYYYNYDNRLIS